MFKISVLFPMETHKKIIGGIMSPGSFFDSAYIDPSPQPRKGSSPCYVTVLNLASLLGFVPFKIKMDSKTKSYSVHQVHLLRKVFCGAVHLTVIWAYVSVNNKLEILTKPTELSSNFIQTFDFVTSIGSLALIILFTVTFWKCQDQLLKIAEETRVEFNVGAERKLIAVTSLILLAAYLCSIYIYRYTYEDTFNVDFSLVFSGSTTKDNLMSAGKAIWTILKYHALSMTYFSYVFIAMIGLTMRGVRMDFCEKMNKTLMTMDMKTGFDHYMDLKELTNDLTRTFGNPILVYYIISVAYFAKIPESSVWQQNVETTAMIVYFVMGAILWVVSAEFHTNVRDVIQSWATQMQDLDDLSVDTRIRLLSVVNDNLLDPIGVSCKFFTITYGFLGSMLGLIVTYAIIVFQMQTKPQSTASASQKPDFIMKAMFPTTTIPSTN